MDVSSIDIISCLLIAYTISTFSYTTKFKMTDSFSSIVCRTHHNNPETLLVSMWELRPPTHLWLSPRSASWWIPRWSWSLYLFRFCSHTSLQCTARPAPPTTACQYHCTGVSLCDQNLLPSGSGSACLWFGQFYPFFQLCCNSVYQAAQEASFRNSHEYHILQLLSNENSQIFSSLNI